MRPLVADPREPPFGKMLALSGALHAVLVGLGIAWLALGAPNVRIAPIAVVELIGGEQFASPPGETAQKAPPAAARPVVPPARTKASPPPSRKREKAAAPEVSLRESRAFSKKIERMREEKENRAKVREAVETIQREKAARAAVKGIVERVGRRVDLSAVPRHVKGSGAKIPEGGMPGAPGATRVSPEDMAYYRALDEKVRASWTVPGSALKDVGKLKVVVRIRIEKDGRVTKVEMETESGDSYFDVSVLRAIKKASPLPVPPEQLRKGEDYFDVGFRFFGEGGDS